MQLLEQIGIITQAVRASFLTEMATVKEAIDLGKASNFMKENSTGLENVCDVAITQELTNKWDETLLYEIAFYRSVIGAISITEEMNITQLTPKYVFKYFEHNPNEFISELYFVNEDIGNGKKETYIYDAKVDIVYKIPNTNLAGNIVHSVEYLKYLDTNETPTITLPDMVENEGSFAEINGVSYYTPNYKGFTLENTYVVYFDETNLSDMTSSIEVPIKEFIDGGSQRTIVKDSKNYVSYDYSQQIWANVVTKNAGKEAWWVWIPRYGYTLDKDAGTTTINFVSTSDTTAHPAFTVDGKQLQGLWVSKYEPTVSLVTESNMLPYYLPDLTGFNPDETYIEIYDEITQAFVEEVKVADITSTSSLKEFCNNNLWFNYDKNIWANIKTVSNGNEAWWVWIPRYAYSIVGNSTDIKFIDIYNNPVDGSDLGDYKVHPAFTVDGKELKGVWVSKYEPTLGESTLIEQQVNIPNLVGFNVDTTYLEIYNEDGTEVKKEILLSDVLSSSAVVEAVTENGVTVNILKSGSVDLDKVEDEMNGLFSNNLWYDYNKQIWANIKTVNNGETSYWTWIPRYAYNIIGNQTDLVFIDKNNNSITSGVELPANYIPHSAFTVDGNELDGIWVSKYEPSGQQPTEYSGE